MARCGEDATVQQLKPGQPPPVSRWSSEECQPGWQLFKTDSSRWGVESEEDTQTKTLVLCWG